MGRIIPDILPRPSERSVEYLKKQALEHPERAWPLDGDIATARNKHETNTYRELNGGLTGDYNWLEVDVRMQDGEPVAAHDTWNHHGFKMSDWTSIGAASQRGVKYDFKESRAIRPTVDLLKKSGIPEERIILNVGIHAGAESALVGVDTLKELRTQFPKAILNLSPSDAYTPNAIRNAVDTAKRVGGPVMFPLNAKFVTPDIVKGFKEGGKVALWNNPAQWDPGNVTQATEKYRSWGVDGMIDLRRPWWKKPLG